MTAEKPGDLSRTAGAAGVSHPDSGFPELADPGERPTDRLLAAMREMGRGPAGLGKRRRVASTGFRRMICGAASSCRMARWGTRAPPRCSNGFSPRFRTLAALEVFEKVLHINYPPGADDALGGRSSRSGCGLGLRLAAVSSLPALVRPNRSGRSPARLLGGEAAAFALVWVRHLPFDVEPRPERSGVAQPVLWPCGCRRRDRPAMPSRRVGTLVHGDARREIKQPQK